VSFIALVIDNKNILSFALPASQVTYVKRKTEWEIPLLVKY